MLPLCAFIPVHKTFTDMSHLWFVPLCKLACLAFWCLPLLCITVVVGIYYRNCLQMQIYYEMAAHRILLDYTPISFFKAPSVWCIIVMAILGATMYFFYEWSADVVVYRVKFTVPYWIPIL